MMVYTVSDAYVTDVTDACVPATWHTGRQLQPLMGSNCVLPKHVFPPMPNPDEPLILPCMHMYLMHGKISIYRANDCSRSNSRCLILF